ncbi:MAG: nickel-dependent hydrogenase large subunit [Syntrophobacteraceae bacterium]|jgi:Ni,Fe-hydrogenase III large subunit
MSFTIPIGPYHPALEEPCKVQVTCAGETVQDVSLSVKYNFRGVEWLAERRNYQQAVALVERVCGICSNVHTLTFCTAVERLAGLTVSERAKYIRTIVLELERLASHALWAGIAAEVMGFQTLFMTCFALREQLMDLLEKLSGNRVHYGMNCIGGVTRDLADPKAVQAVARRVRQVVNDQLVPLFTGDKTVRARCVGTGKLTREQALAWGAVGPTARASGLRDDIRRTSSYAAYARFEFEVPVETSGDVFARVVVRLLEMVESCRIVEQAIDNIPPGAIHGPDFVDVPPGEAVARSEAPRGELFYYVASDGTDIPSRVKIRTPSFVNQPTVRLMMIGANLADVALINASIDPCYSCTSR